MNLRSSLVSRAIVCQKENASPAIASQTRQLKEPLLSAHSEQLNQRPKPSDRTASGWQNDLVGIQQTLERKLEDYHTVDEVIKLGCKVLVRTRI